MQSECRSGRQQLASSGAAGGLGGALRILVVDDEAIVREVLSECLAVDGHRVETASSAAAALEWLEAGRFDLVMTDRLMPGMDGEELARAVKRRNPAPQVVLLTGMAVPQDTAAQSIEGVDLVLAKPVTVTALREALSRLAASAPR